MFTDTSSLNKTGTSMIGLIVSSDVAVKLSMLEALSQFEASRQRAILLARRYHEGDQDAQLTERLRQFLGPEVGSAEFNMNVTANVVTALSERLIVGGFDAPDEDVIEWAEKLWYENRMDAQQEEVHENALRDGECFVIVDWDADEDHPRFTMHPRYTSTEVGGDGFGCLMFYEEDDPNQKPLFGVKQWVEQIGKDIAEHRTLYYPDRVESYRRSNRAQWSLLKTTEWVDQEGKPLGVAMVHFKNKGLRCEAWSAIPMQDAVNKSLIDLISAADLTAFRIFVSRGFIPTTDGGEPKADRSNWLKVQPGQVVGTTKPPSEVAFEAIEGSDLLPLMDLTHQLVLWLAMVTNTPVTRFISTKLIASDETLKEQEGPLLARARNRQVSFGHSWSQAFGLALKLENLFGDQESEFDETMIVKPMWTEPLSRGQDERLNLLLKKQTLKVPTPQLWKEMGYDQRLITRMQEMLREQIQLAQEAIANGNNPADQTTGQKPGGSGPGPGGKIGRAHV